MWLASVFRGFLRALFPNKNKTEILGPDDSAGLAICSAGRCVTHPWQWHGLTWPRLQTKSGPAGENGPLHFRVFVLTMIDAVVMIVWTTPDSSLEALRESVWAVASSGGPSRGAGGQRMPSVTFSVSRPLPKAVLTSEALSKRLEVTCCPLPLPAQASRHAHPLGAPSDHLPSGPPRTVSLGPLEWRCLSGRAWHGRTRGRVWPRPCCQGLGLTVLALQPAPSRMPGAEQMPKYWTDGQMHGWTEWMAICKTCFLLRQNVWQRADQPRTQLREQLACIWSHALFYVTRAPQGTSLTAQGRWLWPELSLGDSTREPDPIHPWVPMKGTKMPETALISRRWRSRESAVRILTARGRSCGALSMPRRPGAPAGTARGLSTDPGAHGRPRGLSILHALQGNRASSRGVGEVSWVFSSCDRRLGIATNTHTGDSKLVTTIQHSNEMLDSTYDTIIKKTMPEADEPSFAWHLVECRQKHISVHAWIWSFQKMWQCSSTLLNVHSQV